jgi:hypothetical protein
LRVHFFLVVIIFLLSFNTAATGPVNSHLYVLWEGLEPDKCAVVWLIKRQVDKEATFKLVKKGSPVENGIPLDTPDSKIQRKQNLSAFEVALAEYKISHPVMKRIGRIIWDIEINKWEKKVTDESTGLSVIINGLIKNEPDPEKALEQTLPVFDALFTGLGGSF